MFRPNWPNLPEKSLYCVREATIILTEMLKISESAARCRIYRAIHGGNIESKRIVGVTRVTQEALIDLLEGDL